MQKVLCHGVFDILHIGHIKYLESAKKFGDYLVVSVTADEFVNKGPGRPHFSTEIRAHMLRQLRIVNEVIISKSPTAIDSINKIQPNFYVKGPDYKDMTKDVTGEIYNEKKAVEKHGGKLVFTDDETYSSSVLANKFFLNWSDDQMKAISKVKELGGMELISKLLEDIAKLKVCIIGEPIIDTYRFCNPLNISSKSPSISAEFLFEEKYEGGSFAIYNHLSSFCDAELIYPDHKLAQKIRYISIDKQQRIFEITMIEKDMWPLTSKKEFINSIKEESKTVDTFILADFGHGLFEGEIIQACDEISVFKAINVQTNSSNQGFNPYTKHKKFNYLSLDTREAQVAFHDNKSAPIDLFRKIHANNGVKVSLTLGRNGAYYYGHHKETFSPAFADQVVDAIGAGDAYFGISALFARVNAPPEIIPFVGNVFAGLKTKILGNKSAVTKSQFLKAAQSILK